MQVKAYKIILFYYLLTVRLIAAYNLSGFNNRLKCQSLKVTKSFTGLTKSDPGIFEHLWMWAITMVLEIKDKNRLVQ